jgi:enediyne biosynthesis protein E4
VGDYDNDGWPDLYVTNYGKNRLYHNNHDGTFTDVAEKAGVDGWHMVCGRNLRRLRWRRATGPFCGRIRTNGLGQPSVSGSKAVNFSFCQYRGVQVMCGPRGLKGEHDHLFHNNGDGTFTDVSKKLGVDDPNGYYGLGALVCGRERGWQAGPAGGQRFHAELLCI